MKYNRTANDFWAQCLVMPDQDSLAAKGFRLTGDMVNRKGEYGARKYVDSCGYWCVQSPIVTPKMFWEIEDIPEEQKPAKEMTVEQIAEALGHDVKIIKATN
jgi:hypothetical protein